MQNNYPDGDFGAYLRGHDNAMAELKGLFTKSAEEGVIFADPDNGKQEALTIIEKMSSTNIDFLNTRGVIGGRPSMERGRFSEPTIDLGGDVGVIDLLELQAWTRAVCTRQNFWERDPEDIIEKVSSHLG